ncbi:MAG TPA: MerR family transcriptional regulator [Streptosporangiaceae bacterium]
MAELSAESGVPVPTIKYYLREGLLPAGERTSPNQVKYDQRHVRRIRLVRALVEVGGLSIASAREVLARMDAPGHSDIESLGKVLYAMPAGRGNAEDASLKDATAEVEALLERRGWDVRQQAPARRALAEVLATLHRVGGDDFAALLDDYAAAAETLAEKEGPVVLARDDVDARGEAVVIGTVVADALLSALRRLAFEAQAAPPRST